MIGEDDVCIGIIYIYDENWCISIDYDIFAIVL